MKLNVKGLFYVFIAFYFLIDPLREMLVSGKPIELLKALNYRYALLLLSSVICFYTISLIAYYAFYKCLENKRWIMMVGIMILAFFIPISIRYLLEQVVYDSLFGFTNYRKELSLAYFYRDNSYYYLLYSLLGAVYFLLTYSKFKEKRELELVAENQKMQLSLLRAQINPHFLLNAMNNIYSLVFLKSEKSLLAIDKLSEILKYTLYENKERVALSEEISYLENFIELQKMRFEQPPSIFMDIDENALNGKVPQFLMVPLIENAFKHGDPHSESSPITISIKKKLDEIDITMSNKKKEQLKDDLGGIGLQNIRKRLDLLFKDRHQFSVKETGPDFTVNIQIPYEL